MWKILFLVFLPIILIARSWTALVYMAADNDLAQWADEDILELESIGSTDDVTIVVQVDKPSVGAKRLYVHQDYSQELQDLGIIDMCDWQILFQFLEWGIRTYPADKYFIILWDHGTGWTIAPQGSFGTDWSSGNRLSISNGDFKKAISQTYNYTGKKIDLFAFDACLMQMIEVAFEIKDFAKICMASQTVCPLQGFCYDRIFRRLTNFSDIDATLLAQEAVAFNVEQYITVQPVVYSAIRLKYLDELRKKNDQLINALFVDPLGYPLASIRQNVQTIPVLDLNPEPDDDYIDMGDFINGLNEVIVNTEIEQLLNVYNNTIVATGHWGSDFNNTTGLTIWFPLTYLRFKQLYDNYYPLTWTQSQWLQFLNWFYGIDDIRPTPVYTIETTNVGGDNNFRICWNRSYDLAPVTYDIIEAADEGLVTIFSDLCEDAYKWNLNGYTFDSTNFYSPPGSFFSGNASNLENSMETIDPISIQNQGLLRLHIYYNTEDMTDSLIIQHGLVRDVHYGSSDGWQERRIILPAGNYRLRISYHTNNSINSGGCYVDDIFIDEVTNGSYIRKDISDTTVYVFNKTKGDYYYAVSAKDAYGNIGNLSSFVQTSIQNYAVPYSLPNPFQNACDIVLDYPDTLQPTVDIFSITGRRVKVFSTDQISNKVIHWDGKDEKNREVGSGLYFIIIKDGAFKKIGKIARQR